MDKEVHFKFKYKKPTNKVHPVAKSVIQFEERCSLWNSQFRMLKIFCFSWNMGSKAGPRSIKDFGFMDSKSKMLNFLTTDVICFSTQECCNSILKSFVCNSKAKWQAKLDKVLLHTHNRVISSSMNAMHMTVYVKRDARITAGSELNRCVRV